MDTSGIDLAFIYFTIVCILLTGSWMSLFFWIGSMFVNNEQTMKLDTIAPFSFQFLEMVVILFAWTTIKRQNLVGFEYTDRTKCALVKVKISFIWIFGLFNLATQVLNIYIASECFRFATSQTIVIMLLYVITQFIGLLTGMLFLTFHRCVILKSSRMVEGCLTIYLLTTAFIWYRSFIKKLSGTFTIPANFGRNQSNDVINGITCYWNHPAQSIFGPVLKLWSPMYVQYFILLVSFVTQMWPRSDMYFRTNLLQKENPLLNRSGQTERLKRKQVIVIASTVILLIRLPSFITQIVAKALKPDENFENLIPSFIGTMVITISLVVCFHLMKVRSIQRKKNSWKAKNIVIIFGAMGYIAHLALSTMSCMAAMQRTAQVLEICKMILETYNIFLQTIFILRGRERYEIDKIFIWSLFISMVIVENLMSWIQGAFVTSLSHSNQPLDTVKHALLAVGLSYNFYSFLECLNILIQS